MLIPNEIILIHIIATCFILTNLDNLVILITLLKASSQKRKHIIIISSYLFATAVIIALTLIMAVLPRKILPAAYLNLFGIIPLGMGIYQIIKQFLRKNAGAKVKRLLKSGKQQMTDSLNKQITLNVSMQLSSSMDNIVIFLPIILNHHTHHTDVIFSLVAAVMSILFSFASLLCTNLLHFKLPRAILEKILPYFLVLLGCYVLFF
jgi:cadmium resistance protein CadD (predicted permease)